jgi:choline monooxygenase
MPNRIQTNQIIPVSHNQTTVIFDYYYHKYTDNLEALIQEDLSYSEVIQQQDIEICHAVQKGLESFAYDRGRFSVKREQGVHHFQNLLKASYRFAKDHQISSEKIALPQ